jgi:hypothetical protein
VRLEPGAKLVNVWVDGQRESTDPNSFLYFDVRMLGGAGTTVRGDRLGGPFGASDLEDDDNHSGFPGASTCSGNVIAGNLFDGYGSSHVVPVGEDGDHPEADGVGVYCPHAMVAHNDFVDISDTAVALFDGAQYMPSASRQESVVDHNVVVSAGNSYSFGIVTDPLFSLDPPAGLGGDRAGWVTRSFAGVRVSNNHLFGGTRTHFDVLLSAGSHDLFGSIVHQNCLLPDPRTGKATCGGGRNAAGARFIGNTDDGLGAQVEMGVYVGGSTGTVLQGNRFTHLTEVKGGACPKGAVVLAVGAGRTSFAPSTHVDGPYLADRELISDSCVTPKF